MYCLDQNGPFMLVFWSKLTFPRSVHQLLQMRDKLSKKVADYGWCYSLQCANWDPTEVSQKMLFWAGLSPPSLFLTMVDCMQCTWTEACCGGEECTHCAKVAIWFHRTSLERQTKESNMCWSLRVIETCRQNNKKRLLAAEVRSLNGERIIDQLILLLERFE